MFQFHWKKVLWICLVVLSVAGEGTSLYATESDPRKELQREIRAIERSANFSSKDTSYINRVADLASEMRYYHADSLFRLAKKTLDLSQKAGYALGESRAYMRLADYHSDKGISDKAIEYYQKALELAKTTGDQRLRLGCLNNLSGEYTYKGDYRNSLNGYLEALELADSLGNLNMQSILNENIANLSADQKDYEQSLLYYKKVKRINDSIGNEVYKAETMSNLASVYADMGKLEYAMFNINQSIDIFEEKRILDWLAFAYETKGKVYLKKYNYKWALYWYNQSEMLHAL